MSSSHFALEKPCSPFLMTCWLPLITYLTTPCPYYFMTFPLISLTTYCSYYLMTTYTVLLFYDHLPDLLSYYFMTTYPLQLLLLLFCDHLPNATPYNLLPLQLTAPTICDHLPNGYPLSKD